jgi:hypothetical protein
MAAPVIPGIDQTIPIYSGTVPNADTMGVRDFESAATELTHYFTGNAVEYNTLVNEVSSFRTGLLEGFIYKIIQIEGLKNEAVSSHLSAENAKERSESARDATLAAVNFKGIWIDQAGSISPPASVYHQGQYWMLISPLANVSAHEPSHTSSNWTLLQTLATVRQPTPISPLSGDTGQNLFPTLSAESYANVYGTDIRTVREFQIARQDEDWATLAYSFSGDVDTHMVGSALEPLSGYKWRCRDVALSGDTSEWSPVQFFVTGE